MNPFIHQQGYTSKKHRDKRDEKHRGMLKWPQAYNFEIKVEYNDEFYQECFAHEIAQSVTNTQAMGRGLRGGKSISVYHLNALTEYYLTPTIHMEYRITRFQNRKVAKTKQELTDFHAKTCNCRQFSFSCIGTQKTYFTGPDAVSSGQYSITCENLESFVLQLELSELFNDIKGDT